MLYHLTPLVRFISTCRAYHLIVDPPKGTLVPRVQLTTADEVEAKRCSPYDWRSTLTSVQSLERCTFNAPVYAHSDHRSWGAQEACHIFIIFVSFGRYHHFAQINLLFIFTALVDAESTKKPEVNPTKPVVADGLVEPEREEVESSQGSTYFAKVTGSDKRTLLSDWTRSYAESTKKPEVNPTKPVVADGLVEPEVKDSKQEPSPEDLTKVNNESKPKKSMTLKNLLDEAKSQPKLIENGKKGRKKVKGVRSWAVNDKEGDLMSPPKLIKVGRKKMKGVRSWVPYVCCCSVNIVN
nr:hypothetical protein [Tanacetum cinerariifolium]